MSLPYNRMIFIRNVNFEFVISNKDAKDLWEKFKSIHNVSKDNSVVKISDNGVHPDVIIEFNIDRLENNDSCYNGSGFKYIIKEWHDPDDERNDTQEYVNDYGIVNFERLSYFISRNYLNIDCWTFSMWQLTATIDVEHITQDNIDNIMLLFFDEEMRR